MILIVHQILPQIHQAQLKIDKVFQIYVHCVLNVMQSVKTVQIIKIYTGFVTTVPIPVTM